MSLGIRVAASIATAILTAAGGDALAEWAENFGWLGGDARDAQHQSVLPTLAAGLAVALALLLYTALVRPATRDTRARAASRAAFAFGTLAASAGLVVLMEAYETGFGGLAPFDAHSVIVAHAPALLAAFVLVGTILHYALGAALHFARTAGAAVAGALSAFARRARGASLAAVAYARRPIVRCDQSSSRSVAGRFGGFRAPPPFASVRLLPL